MYSHGKVAALQCFGLEKTANALTRQIRKAVSGGDLARANRLSRAVTSIDRPSRFNEQGVDIPAATHHNSPGMYLGRLGGGNEGESVLMAHPEHGVHVLQTPSNEGILTPQGIYAKPGMMEQINSPVLPRVLGIHRVGDQTLPPQRRMEYVPGKTMAQMQRESPTGEINDPAQANALARLRDAIARTGHTVGDLDNASNWVQSPAGEWRMVDPLPVMRSGTSTPLTKDINSITPAMKERIGRSYRDTIGDRLDAPTMEEAAPARRRNAR